MRIQWQNLFSFTAMAIVPKPSIAAPAAGNERHRTAMRGCMEPVLSECSCTRTCRARCAHPQKLAHNLLQPNASVHRSGCHSLSGSGHKAVNSWALHSYN